MTRSPSATLSGRWGGRTPGRVDATDLARTRASRGPRGAAVDNPCDINRDGAVNVPDEVLVRSNLGASLPTTAPATTLFSTAAAAPAVSSRRTSFRSAYAILTS